MIIKSGLLGQDPPPYELVQRPGSLLLRRRRRVFGTLLLIAILVVLVQLESITTTLTSVPQTQSFVEGLSKCYQVRNRGQHDTQALKDRTNPRWNSITGQQIPIVIKDASLFDGDSTRNGTFDIIFDSGVIRSVSPVSTQNSIPKGARVIYGGFVTPGFVDMHSHHLLLPFPHLPSTSDVNERPLLGPITPFVRSIDGFKPYDPAIKIIASGGVTSSLVLPGSANIVGGEAYMVKNLPLAGQAGEPVVDELLLEHGLPENSRQRYLKMACGENPKGIYGNTRLGLTWLLREKLEKARELLEHQTTWCEAAFEIEASTFAKTRRISNFLKSEGKRPDSFELETLLALLKGELNINVHCYEPEDFERMLSVLHEFGVHPRAFHHALEAWQVPELLKHLEENITIATFAENSLFKAEAYGANLRGPKILDDHGVQVALKSDHTGEENFAKYLVYQAAIAHSFGLPEDKALQSVTSVPARSVQQDHRIGYVRPGYDADLVIWDDHPLQVGATPSEVFIDGRSTLYESRSSGKLMHEAIRSSELYEAPVMRASITPDRKEDICGRAQGPNSKVLFTGIQEVLIDTPIHLAQNTKNLTLLVEDGQITCFAERSACVSSSGSEDGLMQVKLNNGYITPGLVAFGNNIGIQSIPSESSTGDGSAAKSGDALNEQKAVHFAKYGVHFLGRAFTRARIGGVTRAISAPHSGASIIQGVSVGIRTSVNATILSGGIWKDDVALHFTIGQAAKGDDTPTVSSGIECLRQILEEGKTVESGIYYQAARGLLPVVVRAFNEDDISQLILVKRDFPSVRLVLYGGHAAPLVAKPLAEAGIPVILTGNRGAPDSWEKQNVLTGPPLTESPAKILINAGVLLGLAVKSDSKIHGLAQEARWAGKHAGLTNKQAIDLVSTNLDDILGTRSIKKGHYEPLAQSYAGDFVVWEGNPLRGEGSVVVAVQDGGKIADCWPDTTDVVL